MANPFDVAANAITYDPVVVGLRVKMTDTSAVVAACLSHPLHRSDPKSGCSGGLTNSQATTTVTACY